VRSEQTPEGDSFASGAGLAEGGLMLLRQNAQSAEKINGLVLESH
jgi:hypothetical protein